MTMMKRAVRFVLCIRYSIQNKPFRNSHFSLGGRNLCMFNVILKSCCLCCNLPTCWPFIGSSHVKQTWLIKSRHRRPVKGSSVVAHHVNASKECCGESEWSSFDAEFKSRLPLHQGIMSSHSFIVHHCILSCVRASFFASISLVGPPPICNQY